MGLKDKKGYSLDKEVEEVEVGSFSSGGELKRLLAGDGAEDECLGDALLLALRVFRAGESTPGDFIGDFLAPRVFLAGELDGGTGDLFLAPRVFLAGESAGGKGDRLGDLLEPM